jgi:hypothetical protein
MDLGRYSYRNAPRWEEIMAKLLDHSFPDAPEPYSAETLQRVLRDIEMALTKVEFPAEVEGKDESKALTWFMN